MEVPKRRLFVHLRRWSVTIRQKEYCWETVSNTVRNLDGSHPVVFINEQTKRIQSNITQVVLCCVVLY